MSSAPQKRVRKRSKRLSESEHILEEPPKKKLKRNGKQSGSSGGRGGRVSASAKTSIREKGEKERHRPRKLLVSLNFVQNNLRLNNVPLAETKNGSAGRTEEGSNGSNGDGVLPRRSVQIKFKDSNFTVSVGNVKRVIACIFFAHDGHFGVKRDRAVYAFDYATSKLVK